MYGKHFASMYTGSMVGAGFGPYAVMGYVIANMLPDKSVGFQVELNTKLLSATFGEPEEYVSKAIEYLCAPDPHSRTPANDGRRLVKVGTFAYQVVNGAMYNAIRNEEQRREQNRAAQARRRAAKRKPRKADATAGEAAYVKAAENGASDAQLNHLVTQSLPEQLQ